MFGSRNNNRSGGGRPICQFYLEGRCKFGANCKNEHPAGQTGGSGDQRGRSNAFGSGQTNATPLYGITPEYIKMDLVDERPVWPLSCYGPGKNAPRELLDSEFEQSQEEMRLLHYMAVTNGGAQETAQRETAASQAVDTAIQRILSDLDGAVKYIIDGKDVHPNRWDMMKTATSDKQDTSGFRAPSNTTSFGQPSNFSRNAQPAFGQASTPAAPSSFGQPSASTSAFGQPSNLGQTSSFGKPSALGITPSFTAPAFGQSSQPSGFATKTPAFGQSGFGSTTTQQSTFGQPSAFGLAANKPSPFAAAANNQTQQSTFGQPSSFGNGAPNTSSFPLTTASNQTPSSTFGQPSAFGMAANKPSPFAAAAQTPAQPAFGSASPFGAATNNTSTFGQPSQLQSNAFSTQSNSATQTTSPFAQNGPKPPNAFGQPSQPSQPAQPAVASNSAYKELPQQSTEHLTKDMSGRITAYKGQPVQHDATKKTYTFRNVRSGKQERLWFPDGSQAPIEDIQASNDVYEGELGQALARLYLFAKDNGVFENGIMPETPPKAEWIAFDI